MTELLTRPVTPTEPAPAATPAVVSSEPARLAWARLLVAVTARTVLLLITSMALWGAVPSVIGWQPTTVVTGSMEPKISIGDIAVAMPPGENGLAIGRVLLFDDPDHEGLLRLHRLVSIDDQGLLVTRGDANDADDSSRVSPEDVHGVAVLRIPWIGTPIVWIHEGRYLSAFGVIAALAGLMALSGLDRDLRRPRDEDADRLSPDADPGFDGEGEGAPGSDGDGDRPACGGPASEPAAPARTLTRAMRRLGLVLLVPAVTLGLVVSAAAPAHAAYRAATANPANSLRTASYYNCSSAPLADSASVVWKLDERSGGTAADASGNGFAGSYQGGYTSVNAGCGDGRAVRFNGSSQYLTQSLSGAVVAPRVFSLELWFRTSTSQGGKLIGFGNARTGGSSQYDRHLYLTDDGRLVFGVHPGSTQTISSPSALNDGNWHHAVATLSEAGMQLYVDGTRVARNRSVTTAENFSGFLRVGYDNTGGWPSSPTSAHFAGTLDNIAVYDTALTAAQVRGHWESRS